MANFRASSGSAELSVDTDAKKREDGDKNKTHTDNLKTVANVEAESTVLKKSPHFKSLL